LLEDRLPPGDTVTGLLASSSAILATGASPAVQDPLSGQSATTDTSSISLLNQGTGGTMSAAAAPAATSTVVQDSSNGGQQPSTAGPGTTGIGASPGALTNPLDGPQPADMAPPGVTSLGDASGLAAGSGHGSLGASGLGLNSGPTTPPLPAPSAVLPATDGSAPPSPAKLAGLAGPSGRTGHGFLSTPPAHHGDKGTAHGHPVSGAGIPFTKGLPGHHGRGGTGRGSGPLVGVPPQGPPSNPPSSPPLFGGPPSTVPDKLPITNILPPIVVTDAYSGILGSMWLQKLELPPNWNPGMTDPAAQYLKLFVLDSQGRVLVDVRAQQASQLSAMQSDLVNRLGMVVTGTTPDQYMVTGYMPRKQIMNVIGVTGYTAAAPVWAPMHWMGSVMTEGDAAIKPQGDASVGDGTGTTVGILSDSINQISSNVGTPGIGIAQAQATGDLPARGVNVLQDGTPNNTDEGEGMAEIIYDVAPGANLAFNTSNGGPQAMAAGIQALATTGHANVIVDDTAYPNEAFFNPGVISKAIDQVTSANNVVYVTAAGNLGNNAWQDAYRPVTATIGGTTGTFENFNATGSANVLQQFSLAPGQSLNLDLQWDNAFLEGGSPLYNFQVHSNFNVYITSPDGSRILGSFTDQNLNTEEAMQRVYFTNSGTTTAQYALAIGLGAVEYVPAPGWTYTNPKFVNPLPTTLKWIRFDNGAPAQYQGAPASFGHASDVNAITVGAAPASSPTTAEPSSSQGPVTLMFDSDGTRLGQAYVVANKPSLYGPDGVHTANFPGQPVGHSLPPGQHPVFSGTSAAAAHVAAGAAIYYEAMPSSPSNVIRGQMTGNVTPMSGGGQTRLPPGFFQVVPVTPSQAQQNSGSVLQVGPVVNATDMLGNQSETSIAVDPLNPNELFIGANDNAGAHAGGASGIVPMVASFSTDGGATWHSRAIAGGTDGLFPSRGDPTVAWDQFGNLYYGYVDANNNDVNDIIISTDGGQTFRNLAQITASNIAGAVLDQPSIAAGPGPGGVGGSIWLTADDANGNNKVLLDGAPVSGLGQVGAFIPPLYLPGSTNGAFGDLAVGPQGQVIDYYQHDTSGAGPDKLQANLVTGSFTTGIFNMSNPITITTTNVGARLTIPAQDERSIDTKGAIDWDRSGGRHNGRIYLIYTDSPAVGSASTNIFMRFSDDNGLTWSGPVKVNDDTTSNSHFFPRIAVDQGTGAVAATWYDARNDQGLGGVNDTDGLPNNEPELFGSVSFDGDCFVKNVQIEPFPSNSEINSNTGNDFGDYTGLAFGGSVFHPSWTDNSASLTPPNPDPPNMEIATAAIKVPSILTENDAVENDTSDVAQNFGTLNLTQSQLLESQVISSADDRDNLPDYDWFRWTAGAVGTFSAGFNILATDGDMEIHLFRLEGDGTLTQLAQASSANSNECSFKTTLSVAAQPGQTFLVEVKGANSAPGVYGHGIYDLTVSLK
jgi:hypothetical protein